MKRYYFIPVFILCITSISAQSCYNMSRTKGINAYNAGQYSKAVSYFNAALNTCDDAPANNDIKSWVQKCNTAKQQAEQKAREAKEAARIAEQQAKEAEEAEQRAEAARIAEQQVKEAKEAEQRAEAARIAEQKAKEAEEAEQRAEAARIAEQKAKDEAMEEEARKPYNVETVYVAGGTFARSGSKKNVRQTTLDSFYIGKYEITQALWKLVMAGNPSKLKGDDRPVENVSWDDVQDFIRKLNQKTGKNYRLPTEAEWEYAARGGNKSKGYKYSGSNDLKNAGWFLRNSGNKTHPVGQKTPNELGIYDMSGNVWEWCRDWYDSTQNNPKGTSIDRERVIRGGSLRNLASSCQVSNRGKRKPDSPGRNLGFRLVLPQAGEAEQPAEAAGTAEQKVREAGEAGRRTEPERISQEETLRQSAEQTNRQPKKRPRGYRGFAEAEVGFGDNNSYFGSFPTAHGVQINPRFFVGGGWAYGFFMVYDNNDDSFYGDVLYLFLDLRVNFLNYKVSPFLDAKIGAPIVADFVDYGHANFESTSSKFTSDFYFNPTVGVSFLFTRYFALNLGVGYLVQSVKITCSDYYGNTTEEKINLGGISLKLGLEW